MLVLPSDEIKPVCLQGKKNLVVFFLIEILTKYSVFYSLFVSAVMKMIDCTQIVLNISRGEISSMFCRIKIPPSFFFLFAE